MTSRSYCFTSFQEKLNFDEKQTRYIIFGKEICPDTKKEHWQGYIELFNKLGIKKVKNILGDEKVHLERRRGTREEARAYCMKDGKFEEHGDWSAGGQGARNDLHAIMNDIKEGKSDLEICEAKPDHYERFTRFIRNYRDLIEKKKNEDYIKNNYLNVKLNTNQILIMSELKKQTERGVLWVYDPIGGTGKTFLSKHLIAKGDCFRCTNGKTKDIAYAYHGEKTFIMDLSRSLEDHVNYDLIEQVKNGMLFSAKYESQTKMFEPPKMLILANFAPEMNKLSKDRWQILITTGQGNTNLPS